MGNADYVAIQVSLENTGAASWAASIKSVFVVDPDFQRHRLQS